jgi:hypothetical protein
MADVAQFVEFNNQLAGDSALDDVTRFVGYAGRIEILER